MGIYDMSGNVFEWCWDWWGSYTSTAKEDPTGASSGTNRVLRGGGWSNTATDSRSVSRSYYYPYFRSSSIGFRVVCP